MSDAPHAVPVPATAAAVAKPAPKLNAIQLVEQELGNFFKQREQAVANVHATEGAIQAAQFLLSKLKAEAAKAEAEVKKVFGDVVKAAEAGVTAVENEANRAL